LAGIPPLSGFWPKLALLQAGLQEEQYAIVAAALLTSLLTLLSMTRIWSEAFWKDRPEAGSLERDPVHPLTPWLLHLLPVAALAVLAVLIGLVAEPLFDLSTRAAEQLLNPAGYVETVLGVVQWSSY
jgi:multicomponent Na+:H+ antiporter subunit D